MVDKPFIPEQPPIPGYEPIRALGINLATFYLARHSSSGALVVLKVWLSEFGAHARDLHQRLAQLRHPNIIRVFGMGEFEQYFFYAHEYVTRTLADRLREGPISDAEVARLAHAVSSALQYARDQGMSAQSLTPGSVLLTDENVPKLWDFCTSETFGLPLDLESLARMAPEWVWAGGGTESEASLVHRVGVLMYELLTARPPFAEDDVEATLHRVLHEMPEPPRRVNPKMGRDLEQVCMKCLAKAPEARFASLRELADHLKPLMQSREG